MRAFLVVIWLVCITGALYFVSGKTRLYSERDSSHLSLPPLVTLEPKFIDMVTLGHRSLYDDVITLWALQLIMDERLAQYDIFEVTKALQTISAQKPQVESFYMLSCFALATDLKRPDLCEPIILAGLSIFPESWRLPVTQGFMHAYKMNQAKKAAPYYFLAASRPGAPAYFGSLAKKLAQQEGDLDDTDLRATMELLFGSQQEKLPSWLKPKREKTLPAPAASSN